MHVIGGEKDLISLLQLLIYFACSYKCTFGIFLNVDGAMHFIYSHKYNTNSAEDSSDMN